MHSSSLTLDPEVDIRGVISAPQLRRFIHVEAGLMPHLVGAAILVVLLPVAPLMTLLALAWVTTVIMLGIGVWEGRIHRAVHARGSGADQA